jgi:D-alanine-D-alanine ligase
MLGIPYTHSDPLACALTLDKALAKRVVASHGIPTAPFALVESVAQARAVDLRFPLFVKPNAEGSSMGVRATSRCATRAELVAECERVLRDYRQPALVETFLPGVELTVGVIGNDPPRPIGVMEIRPRLVANDAFVYGLETKRDYENQVEYHVPPRTLDAAKVREVEAVAIGAFRALGCRDVARFDVRLDAAGVPNFIEVNPLPGLSPLSSDIVIMARAAGRTYEQLIGAIVDAALERAGLAKALAT